MNCECKWISKDMASLLEEIRTVYLRLKDSTRCHFSKFYGAISYMKIFGGLNSEHRNWDARRQSCWAGRPGACL